MRRSSASCAVASVENSENDTASDSGVSSGAVICILDYFGLLPAYSAQQTTGLLERTQNHFILRRAPRASHRRCTATDSNNKLASRRKHRSVACAHCVADTPALPCTVSHRSRGLVPTCRRASSLCDCDSRIRGCVCSYCCHVARALRRRSLASSFALLFLPHLSPSALLAFLFFSLFCQARALADDLTAHSRLCSLRQYGAASTGYYGAASDASQGAYGQPLSAGSTGYGVGTTSKYVVCACVFTPFLYSFPSRACSAYMAQQSTSGQYGQTQPTTSAYGGYGQQTGGIGMSTQPQAQQYGGATSTASYAPQQYGAGSATTSYQPQTQQQLGFGGQSAQQLSGSMGASMGSAGGYGYELFCCAGCVCMFVCLCHVFDGFLCLAFISHRCRASATAPTANHNSNSRSTAWRRSSRSSRSAAASVRTVRHSTPRSRKCHPC